ncbi:S8/S53 family peptidase [Pseudomonas stutzeri]|uniref:Peptidase S8 and S53 subtilisin kexin sedolisin n=1 Tax=Stutzerimonas stutzeri TaxID=316 RepID=A0A2N8S2L2_STUST|nr:S8/S53 family peptidase [Stutzerimonas stutzeri]MCQ4296437.1 S8/S53 family peptidase [Stutzerimonas stutzeri]PNF80873.1 peptidase S8 and S53 subtilisin kexin sedolisin [Stutzerimonas stutzeri]
MAVRSFTLTIFGLGLLSALTSLPAAADEAMRITQLKRCGDLFSEDSLSWCLHAKGLPRSELQLYLDGKQLSADKLQRDGDQLRLTLAPDAVRSGPLWLEHQGKRSNPVWLSAGRSQVLAATPDEVARNMDDLTTYVDLVSLIIEEDHEGLEKARQLAEKYGAKVVGAIPPLNTYQLRLAVKNLTERDAMVLRLGSEVGVDAVVIEESAAENEQEPRKTPEQKRPQNREWAANRFLDAVNYYRERIPAGQRTGEKQPVRIGIIERAVDFDAPHFAEYLQPCHPSQQRTCLYARDADKPDNHGSSVAGILAAHASDARDQGFLSALDGTGPGFEVIVERNSDAGITANIAASVNLVEDGARILNWSWGIHRIGTVDVEGEPVDSLLRSGIAMSGYEELLEEFFLWLRREHPDVLVINSAGNGSAHSGRDDYRLPSSFITDQLLVVGGHERNDQKKVSVEHPDYVRKRKSSNVDMRVDITAAACTRAATLDPEQRGDVHCGTSYATPLVAGAVGAMLSVNPELEPDQVRELLRRSAMTIGRESDFEPAEADDLTAPILPSERGYRLDDNDVGRSARLDMRKALELTVKSLENTR